MANEGSVKRAIGLMSGTSMDGIDLALLDTDGDAVVLRGASSFTPFDPKFRKRLEVGLEAAKAIEERDQRPGDLVAIETELTDLHARAVQAFLTREGLPAGDIDVIGFHGQTVLHRPRQALTVQLGDGAVLAAETGIDVVYDLRARDMELGGQGAPLVPAYHRALAAGLSGDWAGKMPVAFVNIGGISNITYIGADGTLLAFDSGPGNALIDQWVTRHAGIPYDSGGAIASEGRVLSGLANRYLSSPFFTARERISLDRNDFLPPEDHEAGLEDGARTLAFVTAAAIEKAQAHLPEKPKLWILTGGGRHNRMIVEDLTVATRHSGEVIIAEEAGLNGDSMEAEAWAWLAVRSLAGLPITYPGTTGVTEPATGGVLACSKGTQTQAVKPEN
ncbi:putative molecular chaperone [Hoeflea phototrophica DFL-43]|uniref:Anhydro-N-acetylmuramic acid kinase n=1 Tax=Hoeflea phototrophica (strain DSM 17068 / NCIMB 14078 / DFL-43) TaxID=411684 RepID=A9D656_HOEPD|nr:anhydro-N-acetylmuramic acid kinase [Hoeflea phototrophica]EDQ33427.1 putative molecular chaperone [Hoeflea phototrophica DFL-43]